MLVSDSDDWPEDCASVMVPAEDLSSTIPGLHPDFSYTLRIRANNSVGLSEPSAKIIVNTDEEGNPLTGFQLSYDQIGQ